jgi:CDP-diacylglycerol--glycerol-3-phosphate 3-phosphatidyltransferase
MDPIADKFLVIGSLVVLSAVDRLPWWITVVIILRELAVTVTRFMVKRKGGEVIAAAQLGKLKTVVQLFAILFYIIWNPTPLWVDLWMYAAVILTIASGIDFYWRTFRGTAPTLPEDLEIPPHRAAE